MKRTAILLILIAYTFSMSSCAADKSQLNITVDPRMELLAAVQLLSGYGEKYGLITRYELPYKADMAEYFAPYKDHKAVKLFAEMSGDGFSFDAPPAMMIYLSAPPDLKIRIPFSDYVKGRAGGEKQLTEFVEALRDFARESKFQAFFDAHKGTYQAVTKALNDEIGGSDCIAVMEEYYGQKQASYTIITSLLFHPGGFGPRVLLPNGRFEVYDICGPSGVKDGLPFFGDRESIKHLAWHEFGHSFANPPGEKNDEELAKYSALFDSIAPKMREQAYGNWQTCVYEHVDRAVEIRMTLHEQGKEAADRMIVLEKTRGFAYIEALCGKLEEYETQRTKYPTFESFYPEIVSVFKSLAEQKLGPEFYAIPFTGTINAVSANKADVVVIMPTHEADKDVEQKLQDYVKEMHDRFHKDSPILTDDEALKQDLSGKSVIAYGTMTGNSWLASLSVDLPFKITPDKIIADKEYPGDQLRFISAWPNPKSPEKGITIYTAQQAQDVIGINGVFHGPTDFLVAKGREVIQAADYVKQKGKWTFK